jgi:hypothetical protein
MASAVALAIIFLGDLPAAFAQQQNQAPPARVTGVEISSLVRSTVLAVHHANITGNYTVLRDLGDGYFRTVNNPVRLGEIFTKIRQSDLDLSTTVLFDPFMTAKPVISPNKVLLIEGFFPTEPLGVVFKMGFRHEFGRWRIFSLTLGTQSLESLRTAQRDPGPGDETEEGAPPTGETVVLPRDKPAQPQN